jgi:hydrogenase expression/formation protein HypC
MRIEAVDGPVGVGSYGGGEYRFRVDFVDARVGDYVLVHAGIAVTKVDEAEALETIELLKQIDELNRSLSRSGDDGERGRGDPA